MPRQRQTIQPQDLTSAAIVVSTETGKVYRLGPPKKRNVNKNVVNHCQLYHRSNGKLAGEAWWNMTNLRDSNFKLYVPTDPNQLPLRKVNHIPCGQCGACAASEPCARLLQSAHLGPAHVVRPLTAGEGEGQVTSPNGKQHP